jgi:hypothetical protein
MAFKEATYRGNVMDILIESALKDRFSEAMNSATTERAEVRRDKVNFAGRSFLHTQSRAYGNPMGKP